MGAPSVNSPSRDPHVAFGLVAAKCAMLAKSGQIEPDHVSDLLLSATKWGHDYMLFAAHAFADSVIGGDVMLDDAWAAADALQDAVRAAGAPQNISLGEALAAQPDDGARKDIFG